MTVRTCLKPSCGRPWDFLPRHGHFYCVAHFARLKDSLEIKEHMERRGCKDSIVFNCREHGVEDA